MNTIIQKVRALLQRNKPVPPADVEELCDEAEALQDLNNRLMRRKTNNQMTKLTPFQSAVADIVDLVNDIAACDDSHLKLGSTILGGTILEWRTTARAIQNKIAKLEHLPDKEAV